MSKEVPWASIKKKQIHPYWTTQNKTSFVKSFVIGLKFAKLTNLAEKGVIKEYQQNVSRWVYHTTRKKKVLPIESKNQICATKLCCHFCTRWTLSFKIFLAELQFAKTVCIHLKHVDKCWIRVLGDIMTVKLVQHSFAIKSGYWK